jgi:hypothetical protein
MPARIKWFFTAMMLALLFIPGVALFTELSRRSDIWWTPPLHLVPLTESADRVVVYLRGRPLDSVVNAGELLIADKGSTSALSAGDVGFRLNNWDRVRAQRIPALLIYAGAIGAGLVMILIVATGRLAYREELPDAPTR